MNNSTSQSSQEGRPNNQQAEGQPKNRSLEGRPNNLTPEGQPSSVGCKSRKREGLQGIARKYEIAGGAITKLRVLEKYDIVVIVDDSSSMTSAASASSSDSPFGEKTSRWEELCDRVCQIVDIAVCLDPDGIDLYFLNGSAQRNISDSKVAKELFDKIPEGFTPLSKCYSQVIMDKLSSGSERPLLIVIATDGEPNRRDPNKGWIPDVEGFQNLVKNRANPSNSPTSIMACTDAPFEIGWLEGLDKLAPNVDVIDDFEKVRLRVYSKQGPEFPFSMGDYVVKSLIGPLDNVYDIVDCRKLNVEQLEAYLGRPCTPEEIERHKPTLANTIQNVMGTCCCRR